MQRYDWTEPETLSLVCRSIYRTSRVAVKLEPYEIAVEFPSLTNGQMAVGLEARVPASFDFLWIGLSGCNRNVGTGTAAPGASYRIRATVLRTGRTLGTGAEQPGGVGSKGWMHMSLVCGVGGFPRLFVWPLLIHAGDTVAWDAQKISAPGSTVRHVVMHGYAVRPPVAEAA